MKEIQIIVRIDDKTERMASIIKNKEFDKETLSGILFMVGILENLKQEQLNKLQNLGRMVK
jgi:hypothetical protein